MRIAGNPKRTQTDKEEVETWSKGKTRKYSKCPFNMVSRWHYYWNSPNLIQIYTIYFCFQKQGFYVLFEYLLSEHKTEVFNVIKRNPYEPAVILHERVQNIILYTICFW